MTIDQEALREAYFNPPDEGEFRDIPTREDYMAEAERRFVNLCLERGGDPKAEGLGKHGALIGGPDKPVRLHTGGSRRFHHYARPRLAPLNWFDRPAVRTGNGRQDPEHVWLQGLVMSYMAGVPKESRPSGQQIHDAFHKEQPDELERFWLYSVLSCATLLELRRMMYAEGLSIRTVVGALHVSGVLRHDQSAVGVPGGLIGFF